MIEASAPTTATTATEAKNLLAGRLGLVSGDDGYWPVVGATGRDLRAGDLVRFDDGTVDLVADVLDFDGLRVRYVTAAGKTVGFGVLCPVKIDRWAASGTLAGGVR